MYKYHRRERIFYVTSKRATKAKGVDSGEVLLQTNTKTTSQNIECRILG
jgi:hypothetical protein